MNAVFSFFLFPHPLADACDPVLHRRDTLSMKIMVHAYASLYMMLFVRTIERYAS
jgi:hypothetical protein